MSLIGALVELQVSLLRVKTQALKENKNGIINTVDEFYPKVDELVKDELEKEPIRPIFCRGKR